MAFEMILSLRIEKAVYGILRCFRSKEGLYVTAALKLNWSRALGQLLYSIYLGIPAVNLQILKKIQSKFLCSILQYPHGCQLPLFV